MEPLGKVVVMHAFAQGPKFFAMLHSARNRNRPGITTFGPFINGIMQMVGAGGAGRGKPMLTFAAASREIF